MQYFGPRNIRYFILSFYVFCYYLAESQTIAFYSREDSSALTAVHIINLDSGEALNSIGNVLNLKDAKYPINLFFEKDGFQSISTKIKTLNFNDTLNIFLNENRIALSSIIVTATKRVEDRFSVPLKINSISSQDIQIQQAQTSADLLQLSGNIYVQKSQLGGGSPMIRGFSANRVLISVDGIRMNNAIFRSGNLQNVINIDPFSLEGVEIIMGPGSTIYGSDAIGGVMAFRASQLILFDGNKGNITGQVSTRYSTANSEKTMHAHFKYATKKWASYTSISFSDFDDLIMGTNGPDDYLRSNFVSQVNGKDTLISNPKPRKQISSGYSALYLTQKMRYKPSENWDFNMGIHFSTTSDIPRYDRLIRPRGNGLRSAEWFYGPQTWMLNRVSAINTASNKIYDKLTINAAYQYFEESRNERDFQSSIRNSGKDLVHAFSINIDFDKRANAETEIFYGLELIDNTVLSSATEIDIITNFKSPAQSRYPNNSKWQSMGAYTYLKRTISPIAFLNMGIRYNFVKSRAIFDNDVFDFPFSEANLKNGALSGSIGINLNFTPATSLIANISSGFRAPNIDDIGKVFDSSPGFVVVPNPDLTPEYIYSSEIAINQKIGQRFRFDLSLSYSYLNNAIVRRNSTFNGLDSILYKMEVSRVQSLQNASYAQVYSVEGGLIYSIAKNLSFESFITYTSGSEILENGEKAPLRHAPPMFGKTSLIYKSEKFHLNFYSIYHAAISADDMPPSEIEKDYIYAKDSMGNPYSPAWLTFNVKSSIFVGKSIVALALENITNQRYRPFSSGISAPGINLILSLTYKF